MTGRAQEVFAELEALFAEHGKEAYGEDVTQLEHMLQCAACAASEGASDSLVAAALLHDVGHLIEEADDAYGYHKHDRSGAAFLSGYFGPEVSEPVRLHVAAKRYLCAVEPEYFDCLSAASVHSLSKQGGPMSAEEVAAFERNPQYRDAVRLRRWDDLGKVEGLKVEGLAHYRPLLESLVRS
ncbi:MAG: phosphonate degradation HD-domain oxygenase [Rhodovibrionaceae bacterium]